MIYDSTIWKDELKNKTEDFKRLLVQTEFSVDWLNKEENEGDTASYKFFIEFQKYCFYSAVITRKFIESKRLSDELLSTNYSIKCFKRKSKKILTKDNFESVEQEYDTESEYQKHFNVKKICDWFIHSFLFTPELIERKINETLPDEVAENWDIKGISGLYINTDWTKETEIYFLPLSFVTDFFEKVYEDKVIYFAKNNETGKEIRSGKNPNLLALLEFLGLKK